MRRYSKSKLYKEVNKLFKVFMGKYGLKNADKITKKLRKKVIREIKKRKKT